MLFPGALVGGIARPIDEVESFTFFTAAVENGTHFEHRRPTNAKSKEGG